MCYKSFLLLFVLLGLLSTAGDRIEGQDDSALRVVVNLVQLNVAVTDKNGNYITGLRPEDFLIKEDGITEKLAAFAQGDEPARSVLESPNGQIENTTDHSADNSTDHATDQPPTFSSLVAGSDVFVLFDTSNYMYRDFVFAEDSISEFIHSLESADKIAFYSYSLSLIHI